MLFIDQFKLCDPPIVDIVLVDRVDLLRVRYELDERRHVSFCAISGAKHLLRVALDLPTSKTTAANEELVNSRNHLSSSPTISSSGPRTVDWSMQSITSHRPSTSYRRRTVHDRSPNR